jgi:hypothetical protein
MAVALAREIMHPVCSHGAVLELALWSGARPGVRARLRPASILQLDSETAQPAISVHQIVASGGLLG